MSVWSDLPPNLRCDGINMKWIGADDRVWHIGGQFAGREGAIVIPPVSGLAHVPFKQVKHEPAYGPPRFERSIDEMREIGLRIALANDDYSFGWFDVEARWWAGMDRDRVGWFTIWSRKFGELYVPAQLLESIDTDFDDDPTLDNCMVWDIKLGVDGEPRWRQPDVRTPPWKTSLDITTTVKRDDEKNAPDVTVGVGKFKIVNRGTQPSWPVITLEASSNVNRYWISDGSTTRMLRVPPLNRGEHIVVDTNPEHRIAISAIDPVDDAAKRAIRNSELLQWLFGSYGEAGISVLERFHGQGFEVPIAPRSVGVITVYSDHPGNKVSVRLPQRFDRALS